MRYLSKRLVHTRLAACLAPGTVNEEGLRAPLPREQATAFFDRLHDEFGLDAGRRHGSRGLTGEMMDLAELRDVVLSGDWPCMTSGTRFPGVAIRISVPHWVQVYLDVYVGGVPARDLLVEIADCVSAVVRDAKSSFGYGALTVLDPGVLSLGDMKPGTSDIFTDGVEHRPGLIEVYGEVWRKRCWTGLPEVGWRQWLPGDVEMRDVEGASWSVVPPLTELTLGELGSWLDAEDSEANRVLWRDRVRYLMAPEVPLPPHLQRRLGRTTD